MEYVIYVFSALIPYIGFMEALTSGCVAIKQNIHLVKNVLLPIELIPVRYVLLSLAAQLVSLTLLLALIVWQGAVGPQLLLLPVAVLLQAVMLIGMLWFISPITVVLPDMTYFVNLAVLLLMFISPIGFRPEMVPNSLRFALYFNPVFYMTEVYRATLIPKYELSWHIVAVYIGASLVCFVAGDLFFARFKKMIADYE
jgi:lipopolysaccharide transport system permease protein